MGHEGNKRIILWHKARKDVLRMIITCTQEVGVQILLSMIQSEPQGMDTSHPVLGSNLSLGVDLIKTRKTSDFFKKV
jgi:hypothetical protein